MPARLTEEQRRRASAPPACRIPFALALRAARGRQDRYERLLGFAVLAYVEAAGRFDPARNPEGERGFAPWAALLVRRRMLERSAQAAARLKNAPRLPLEAVPPEALADRRRGPDGEAALADLAAWALAVLDASPARQGQALRLWLGGAGPDEAGRRMGVSKQAALIHRQRAVARLRLAAGIPSEG